LLPAELVERAFAGEREAEAELCRRFFPAVRTFARRRLRGTEAVDEFTQDVLVLFVQALRARAVEQPERVGGFVLGICKNVALERARQAERRRELWDKYGSALAVVVKVDLREATYESMHLEDCMSQLSQRAREVVRLSYTEELSHDEIASRLEISAQNARVLRHRTLFALRECMAKRISWEAA
jgi:RNA polymerase sigma-70 factor (ECF subfamily)